MDRLIRFRRGEAVRKALGYLWLIASNIFSIFVTIYVLDRLHDRSLTIIVSVLGLIYVAIRSHSIVSGMISANVFLGLVKGFVAVEAQLKGEQPDLIEETIRTDPKIIQMDAQMQNVHIRAAIGGASLSIISLICLYYLFSVLLTST